MKVSIIIPVYNAEKYIDECIKSAIHQTYKPIEVIAVDDGSTDNSLKIIKKFSKEIQIITKPNGGTATALNTGINSMTGEWFKWLSADDLLYPNAIEDLICEAKNFENKDVIFYSHYDLINSKGELIRNVTQPDYNYLSNFDLNVRLLDQFFGSGTTSMFHKSIMDKYGVFDETIGFQEDYELWLRYCLLHDCRLHLVPKTLAKYRVHPQQLTKTKRTQLSDNANKIRRLVLAELNSVERERYLFALREYRKQTPLLERTKTVAINIMIKVLPKSTADKILDILIDREGKRSKNRTFD